MAVHTCVNSQTPPLLYRSQQSKFWLPEGSPLAKGCKCWLLEEWKHVVSYVPEIEMGSKGNRTEDQQHLWGGTLLSVNDTYEVVGERLPWRPVVKTSLFNAGLVVLIPGPGAKGFPGSIVLRIHLQCRRHRFNPCIGKIPWRRKWQPTPVFLLGKSNGQRSLVGYGLWLQKSGTRLSN